jgi:hypothetical protein
MERNQKEGNAQEAAEHSLELIRPSLEHAPTIRHSSIIGFLGGNASDGA